MKKEKLGIEYAKIFLWCNLLVYIISLIIFIASIFASIAISETLVISEIISIISLWVLFNSILIIWIKYLNKSERVNKTLIKKNY